MKRILIIVAIVAVAAVGGWAGLWFLGKGELESRIDLEAAGMERQGWTVTWGSRTVSGFPSTYLVQLTDLAVTSRETGALVRIPDVTLRQDAEASDRLLADLPPEITVALPISEGVRAGDETLPRILNVRIDSTALTLGAMGDVQQSRAFDLTADSLSVAIDQTDFAWRMAFETDAIEAAMRPTDGGDTVIVKTARMKGELLDRQAQTRPELSAEFRDASITSFVAFPDIDDLVAAIASAEKTLDGAFTSGSHTILITSLEGNAEQRIDYQAGAASGLFTLAGGVLDYQAEEREVRVAATLPFLGPDPHKAGADLYQRRLKTPVIPTEQPVPGALRIVLGGVAADKALWDMFDPTARLDRTPAELEIDLETTQRLNPRASLPVEFANISVKRLNLTVLGAEADVTGDVEILQPINLPLGDLNLRLTGVSRLLGALTEAGLIPYSIRQTGDAMLEVYAKPGDTPDTWTSPIKFENTGMTVNGLPVPPEQAQ